MVCLHTGRRATTLSKRWYSLRRRTHSSGLVWLGAISPPSLSCCTIMLAPRRYFILRSAPAQPYKCCRSACSPPHPTTCLLHSDTPPLPHQSPIHCLLPLHNT